MEPTNIENPIAEADFMAQQTAINKAMAFYKKEKGYCDEAMEGVPEYIFDIMAKYAYQERIRGKVDGICEAVAACAESAKVECTDWDCHIVNKESILEVRDELISLFRGDELISLFKNNTQ